MTVRQLDSDRTSAAVSWTSSSQSFGFVPVPLNKDKEENKRKKDELKPIAVKRVSFHGPPSPSAPVFTVDASLSSDVSVDLDLPDVSVSADVSVDGPGKLGFSGDYSVDVDVPSLPGADLSVDVNAPELSVDVKAPELRADVDVSVSGSASARGKFSARRDVNVSGRARIDVNGAGDATVDWPFGEGDERPPTADSLNG